MIAQTFADLRASLPSAEIVAVGPSIVDAVSPATIRFDAAVQQAAASVGAHYISLIDPDVLDSGMATADGGHVDDSGHAAISEAILSQLR
jgi:hypothetical protein